MRRAYSHVCRKVYFSSCISERTAFCSLYLSEDARYIFNPVLQWVVGLFTAGKAPWMWVRIRHMCYRCISVSTGVKRRLLFIYFTTNSCFYVSLRRERSKYTKREYLRRQKRHLFALQLKEVAVWSLLFNSDNNRPPCLSIKRGTT